MHRGIHTNTRVYSLMIHAHGGRKALVIMLAPDMHSGSHSRAHLDTLTLKLPELRAGGGAGALQAQRHTAPLPAPWGSLQMPGVILSLDQWAIFGDTGLVGGGQAEETRGRCPGAVLWRETPASREDRLGKGVSLQLSCSISRSPRPANVRAPERQCHANEWPDPRTQPVSCGLSLHLSSSPVPPPRPQGCMFI